MDSASDNVARTRHSINADPDDVVFAFIFEFQLA